MRALINSVINLFRAFLSTKQFSVLLSRFIQEDNGSRIFYYILQFLRRRNVPSFSSLFTLRHFIIFKWRRESIYPLPRRERETTASQYKFSRGILHLLQLSYFHQTRRNSLCWAFPARKPSYKWKYFANKGVSFSSTHTKSLSIIASLYIYCTNAQIEKKNKIDETNHNICTSCIVCYVSTPMNLQLHIHLRWDLRQT